MLKHLLVNIFARSDPEPVVVNCMSPVSLIRWRRRARNRNRNRYRNRNDMTLGHERLDVYCLSIGYVAWVYEKADSLNGDHRLARDRIAALLSRLGGRGYCIKEDAVPYGC